MLQALDDAAERAGRTRNELISLALEFALEHLDIPQTHTKAGGRVEMVIIKCKMCGGDLNIEVGMTVAECEYCGTLQTVPTADSERN